MGPARVGAPGVRAAAGRSSAAVARVALICPDLLFGSKLRGALRRGRATRWCLRATRPTCRWWTSPPTRDERLAAARRTRELPTLAFYSHVELDVRRRAEEAGVDRVVPRSRMAREAAALVDALAAAAASESPRPARVERAAQVGRAARGSRSARRSGPTLAAPPRSQPERRPQGGGEGVELGAPPAASSSPDARRHLAHRGGRVGRGPPRCRRASAASVSAHEVAALVERAARGHGEHQLGVGRRAVAVHPELARGDAAAAQRHALGVPERDRGVHAPGHRLGHRGEADRHAAHPRRGRRRRSSPPRAARRRRRAGRSRPRGGPRGRAGGVCRRGRSPRRAGRCTSAPTPTRSSPRSRASPRSWMSTTAMSARPAREQLQRVRGRRRARAPPGSRRGARRRRPGSRCRCRSAPRSAGSRAPAGRR